MKSKVGLIGLVLGSSLFLSACTNQETKTTINEESTNQTQQNAGDSSGIPQGRTQGQQQMDLVAAAEKLGVTEDELKEALGWDNIPSGGPQGERNNGQKPNVETATKTEE